MSRDEKRARRERRKAKRRTKLVDVVPSVHGLLYSKDIQLGQIALYMALADAQIANRGRPIEFDDNGLTTYVNAWLGNPMNVRRLRVASGLSNLEFTAALVSEGLMSGNAAAEIAGLSGKEREEFDDAVTRSQTMKVVSESLDELNEMGSLSEAERGEYMQLLQRKRRQIIAEYERTSRLAGLEAAEAL